MSRNSSGTCSLASSPFTANTPIASSPMNANFSDIITMMTDSLSRSGQGGMTAVLALAGTGFTYGSDTNTGMYRSAADTQIIKCGGVDVVEITTLGLNVVGALTVNGVALPTASSTTTFSNKTLNNTCTVTLKDTLFTLQDDEDVTKQGRFNLSNVLTASTAIYLMPMASTAIVGNDTTDTLTNKTLTRPVINTGVSGTAISTDGTLAENSDTLLSSQKAIKTYVDSQSPGQQAFAQGSGGQAFTGYLGFGGNGMEVTEANAQSVMSSSGTIKKLYVKTLTTVGGSGQTSTFTVRKNGVDTAITCQISSGASSANDIAHSVSYVAGDLVCTKVVNSATTGTVTSNVTVLI